MVAKAAEGTQEKHNGLEDLQASLIHKIKFLSCRLYIRGQQSRLPVSWALELQGFWLKRVLYLLLEISAIYILHHSTFFSIAMLFSFIVLHFKYRFGLFLQVQVHLLCIIVWLYFALYLSMSLQLEIVVSYKMGLQVYDQKAEGFSSHTA